MDFRQQLQFRGVASIPAFFALSGGKPRCVLLML